MTAVDPRATRFRLVPDTPLAELEQEILATWAAENLFRRTLEARAGGRPWVFFEGPPTANGRPGIHHVFSRTVKDLFCRHRTMHGRFVARKAGWDTHGLPVEIEVEKRLGISGKQQIEAIGVEEFNRLCRESVWQYRGDWERLSERIGFWLDYDDAYVTYTNAYVESVWWALATLYQRGLLYRGHKILPYCARCGTALSSHELAQGYADVKDPSVYVALDLLGEGSTAPRRRILVWTTTPWTLVSNTALAVHPDLEYVELRRRGGDDGTLVLAAARAGAVLGQDFTDRWDEVGRMLGGVLAGVRYRRPLDWVEYGPGAHELIVAEDFVSAEDGSGVVHMAPAFGADDYAAGRRHGLAFVQPVNARGEFPTEMPVVGGRFVKDADPLIVDALRRRGVLWKAGTLEHAYPHCWRCDTPLIYYARSSWFVRTTAYRDEMLARNGRVDWHPEEVGIGRFGEWLKNNIDWAISRDRYWGTPLPVWVCERDAEHVEVIGSYAELARRAGTALPEDFDPHKPFIDRYTWPCAQCAATASGAGAAGGDPDPTTAIMRRAPEVIDTWFDSGSMPFAEWHFPFEHHERLAVQYPADFIAEGIDQTRGWFYSLLAIATGLGDAIPNNTPLAAGRDGERGNSAPYRSVVVNELVLDADGLKMSKSRGNVVDPNIVVGRYGADAVRLFLVTAGQVWSPRRFDEQAIRELAGRFFLTLKNVYNFFALYANFGWMPSADDPPVERRSPLDRWVLSRLATVQREADALLERFDATAAAKLVMAFVDEDVSKWYLRRRSRFYEVTGDDNRAAFATLHAVLVASCRLLAPIAPFVTDWIHRELVGESVHLAPYVPAAAAAVGSAAGADPRELGGGEFALPEADVALEADMAEIRTLATLGRAAREAAGINVRQPLAELVCVVPGTQGEFEALFPLLQEELNVKKVVLAGSADTLVRLEARPNFRSLGKKFGKATPLAAQAVSALTSEALRGFEQGEPLAISVGNEARTLDAEDLTIVRRAAGALVVEEKDGRFAAINPTITLELRREGLARELVSRIQRARKDAGYAVSDRIRMAVAGNEEAEAAVSAFREWIAGEVLARELRIGADAVEGFHAAQTVDLDGVSVVVAITRD